MNKILRSRSFIASSIAVVTFTVFLPSLQNEFVNWDDNVYVYENPFIRSLDTKLFKAVFGGFYAANWHPLTWISHALDYFLWGLNPLGHHLTNNVLHALNTFVVVLLVVRLLETAPDRPRPTLHDSPFALIAAATTGLLFGLHPLHVESVAWVSERKDLLSALFFLLGISAYASFVSGTGEKAHGKSTPQFLNRKYLLALMFFILALLSKPMAVSLPFVLLILDWYPFRRILSLKTFWTAFLGKLPFIVVSLLSSILTILAQKAGGALNLKLMDTVPLSTRLLVAANSLIGYLGKMIVPIDLIPYHPYPADVSLFSLEHLSSIILVAGITAVCILAAKRWPLWLCGWSYYLITLLPVLGIIQVGSQSMADRYTYLPSLGPFFVIGLSAAWVYRRITALKRQRVMVTMVGFVVALGMLITMSYATVKQIGIWKDSIVLWNYTIEKDPSRVAFPHYNLGLAYASKGLIDMAIEQYEAAVRLRPDYAEARSNLGLAYASKGLIDMAIEQYQTAIRLRPDFAEAHSNLGIAYASKGLMDMAIAQYQTAVRLRPGFAEAHFNLGLAYAYKGLINMAIAQYQTAVRLKPDYVEAYFNLGAGYESKGLIDNAIAQYRTVLRLNPEYAEAHFTLGTIYLNHGSKDMARTEFEAGLRIKPDDYKAWHVLKTITAK